MVGERCDVSLASGIYLNSHQILDYFGRIACHWERVRVGLLKFDEKIDTNIAFTEEIFVDVDPPYSKIFKSEIVGGGIILSVEN